MSRLRASIDEAPGEKLLDFGEIIVHPRARERERERERERKRTNTTSDR